MVGFYKCSLKDFWPQLCLHFCLLPCVERALFMPSNILWGLYIVWSSLCSSLQSPVTSSLTGPNILHCISLSKTPCACSSSNLRTRFLTLSTYLLTPWSRVLEKLTGSAASQEIPRIFGTRSFVTILTSARHLSLSWANSIQSPNPLPLSEDPC